MHIGLVDHYSPSIGISGWAFDADNPDEPLKLGLYFGDALVVATIAAMPRPDVMERHPECSGFVGFRFSPLDFLALASIEGQPDSATAEIRVLEDGKPLREAVKMPTRFGAIAACEAAVAATTGPNHPGPPAYGSLIQRLKHYRRLATRTQPAARYKQVDGFIETVAGIGEDTVMLGGWLTGNPGAVVEGAGFLFTDDRIHCGVSIAAFPHQRSDLPAEACQFIAIAHGAWTPSPESRLTGGLQLAGASPLFLLASDKLNYVSGEIYDAQLGALGETHGEKLPPVVQQFRSLLYHAGEFGSSRDTGSIRCSLDLLVAVPGFGFVANGWMLLGGEKLETLEIRHGEALAPAVPGSLAFSPRPDLAGPYPRENVDRAGFVVAFECPDEVLPRGPLQLRMELAGGRTYVMDVAPDQVASVHSVGDLAKIGKVFPDIDAEDFGPRMRSALTSFFCRNVDFLDVALPKETAGNYLVVLLPADESLCRLHLACAGRLVGRLPDTVGVCFLATGAGTRRSLRQWLLYEPNLAARTSAAFVVSEHFTLHHVPKLFETLPMERLAICMGPPIFEEDAEEALAAFLNEDDDTPLAIVNDGGHRHMNLRVLATTRDRIETYVAVAPFRFRGENSTALRALGHRFMADDAIELTPEKRADDIVDLFDAMTDRLDGAHVAH